MYTCDSNNLAPDSVRRNNVREWEFGNFRATNDWIESESTTYPGKKYFFNLRTGCSTWIRPVSNHVPLQFYDKQSSIYRNNLTSDLDDPLMVVSSENEDDDESENAKGGFCMKIARKNYEIFTRFFCYAKTFNYPKTFKYPNYDDYNYILNPLCTNNNFCKLSFRPRSKPFRDSLRENGNSKKTEISTCPNSSADVSKPLKLKLCKKKSDSAFERRNGQPTIRTTSSDKDKKSGAVKTCCATLVQKVNPGCLLEKVVAKKGRNMRTTKRNQSPLKKEKLKATPIICEMYGTRTINYNNIEPELPPEVKCTNLSDSSVTSVFCRTDNITSVIPNSFELPNANFNVDLSSTSCTSSSSTCSSSCSCSTSSDTNRTTSSKANSASK